MSDPIQIVVTAQTAEATANLQTFAKQTTQGLNQVEQAAHGSAGGLNTSRMALMELGHSARSVADGLAAGMNPLRLLSMEAPRLAEALGLAGFKLGAFVPYLGAAAAAAAVFGVEWYAVVGHLEDSNKVLQENIDQLNKIPAILEKIQSLQKAGLVSSETYNEFADYLNGRKKLYVGPDGQVTTQSQHPEAERIQSLASAVGGPAVLYTGNTVNVPNAPASQEQINDWVQKQLPPVSDEQAKAAAKLKDLMAKAHEGSLDGFGQQEAAIHERYQQERDEISLTLQQAGKLVGPEQYAAAQSQLKQLGVQEGLAIAKARKQALQEAWNKDQAEGTAQAAHNKQTVTQQEQELADQIEQTREQTRDKNVALYQDEYLQRIELAQKQYEQGLLTDDELSQKWREANKERIAGEKEYTAELERQAQLKMELARGSAEGQLKAIESSPFLTNRQKASASIAPIQRLIGANASDIGAQQAIAANPETSDDARATALERVNQLLEQQVELEQKLQQAQGQNSFLYNFRTELVALQNQMGSLAEQASHLFGATINTAINSISQNLTRLIEGTISWGRALRDIGAAIVNEIVSGIVKAVVQMVILAAITSVARAAGVSISTQKPNPVTEAGWGASAMMRAIADLGPIAGPIVFGAEVAAGTATGASAGFSEGGYTGAGSTSDIAGIVHRGEFVFSAPAVNRLGLDNLEAIHHGTAAPAAGAVSGGAPGGVLAPKVVTVFDRQSLKEELARPDYAHITVQHVMSNKTKIGIRT